MARTEKTVFISYRRKDISWALAVYQYLTSQKYDVFFDFSSLSSGDFEEVIVSNIRARAHFVLILTPTALDRCNEPEDWLRREIEVAIDEKRNIIPLFFDSFSFGSLSVAKKLTGKLGAIRRYNGLDIPSGYFMEAMERLRSRYLNVPLTAVIHPVSTEVRKVVKEEQVAADRALLQKQEDIEDLVKPAEEIARKEKEARDKKNTEDRARKLSEEKARKENEERERKLAEERARKEPVQKPQGKKIIESKTSSADSAIRFPQFDKKTAKKPTFILSAISGIIIVALVCLYIAGSFLIQNLSSADTPTPTDRNHIQGLPVTLKPMSKVVPTNTVTQKPPTTRPTIIVSTNTPPPNPVIGSTLNSSIDGMVMVYVPAGEFRMGSNDGEDDEKPVHTVYLEAFWIDQSEVTNFRYALCVNSGDCTEPSDNPYYSQLLKYYNHPVVYVSWGYANAYCKWTNRRLPTEAEWEKAASWDDENQIKRVYPWGNNIDCSFANYLDRKLCIGTTTTVGSYPGGASPYGALDMAGNVWEWVADWYSETYYSSSPSSKPLGPDTEQYRVVRGGSWIGGFGDARSADRHTYIPNGSVNFIGFRCALSE